MPGIQPDEPGDTSYNYAEILADGVGPSTNPKQLCQFGGDPFSQICFGFCFAPRFLRPQLPRSIILAKWPEMRCSQQVSATNGVERMPVEMPILSFENGD